MHNAPTEMLNFSDLQINPLSQSTNRMPDSRGGNRVGMLSKGTSQTQYQSPQSALFGGSSLMLRNARNNPSIA